MASALQHASNLLGQVTLNPIVTAALLYLVTKSPDRLRGQLLEWMPTLKDPKRYGQIVKALTVCFAFGVTGVVNRRLNSVALNAWRWRNNEKKRWDWENEVAVVTGGCGGIGELMARKLAEKGVRVAVLDVKGLPASLEGHTHITFFPCDVTDPDTVYATAKQVKETLGAPTILINNAGILAPHTILATPDPYLRKLFDVNVLANWYTTKAFLPAMIAANKGHIVTVASMASFIGVAGLADYCASKAAVLSFHEALDQELKHHYEAAGVLTTSVHPGWIRTPLLKEVEGELKAGGAEMIEPEDVAEAVVNRIVGCSGGQVFLPGSGAMGSGMRGWPNWVQERVRDGASRALLGSATVKAG